MKLRCLKGNAWIKTGAVHTVVKDDGFCYYIKPINPMRRNERITLDIRHDDMKFYCGDNEGAAMFEIVSEVSA